MRNKALWLVCCTTVALALTVGIRALAQDSPPTHFSGVINDLTPINGGTAAWELRGLWNLSLNEDTGTADFSAALTMELSVLGQSSANALAPHTHHVTMTGATVTFNPSDCPAHAPGTPGYASRLEVKGMATVAANGGPFPPPPATPQPSQLQVCIDGGTNVAYSNVTLVFGPPASGHFGPQTIHGVVRKASSLGN